MAPISGETCAICGDSISPGAPLLADFARSGKECAACGDEKPHFSKATAYGPYDGSLRELIHLFKFDRVEPAAAVLGTMLAEAIVKLNVSSALVIPVPLHVAKRRDRGFNQSELITRKALNELGLKQLELATDALERIRPTVSQIGLTRPQRIENLRGAFRVKHLSRIKGCEVLLVDDVMTTGTTASECARVLRKAGAQSVWVATVARTLKKQGNLGMSEEFEPALAS